MSIDRDEHEPVRGCPLCGCTEHDPDAPGCSECGYQGEPLCEYCGEDYATDSGSCGKCMAQRRAARQLKRAPHRYEDMCYVEGVPLVVRIDEGGFVEGVYLRLPGCDECDVTMQFDRREEVLSIAEAIRAELGIDELECG